MTGLSLEVPFWTDPGAASLKLGEGVGTEGITRKGLSQSGATPLGSEVGSRTPVSVNFQCPQQTLLTCALEIKTVRRNQARS